MRVVVIGGTGLIGSKLVTWLREHGATAIAASPATGVDTLSREGLVEAVDGASVVVDVSNSPSYEDARLLEFFETSTRNLLAAEYDAGVGHHVALSVVGADRLPDSGYLRAKVAQERLVERSLVPHSIVRATQFFEFLEGIAEAGTDGDTVRLAPALIQPVAADDVAAAVSRVAIGPPVHGIVEVGGPDRFRLDEIVRRVLREREDPREVVADPHARYFGAELGRRSLLPDDGARLAPTTLDAWLRAAATAPAAAR
jgi:uncharacterized protein YbjT (DUF2867 family)